MKKFYTAKAFEYTVAIATMGLKGMSELANMAKNGFSMIRNSSMQEILKKAAEGIQNGFVNGLFDTEAILKKSIFLGVSSMLGN